MGAVVIHADTVSSPELRHEIPLVIVDPFLYVEQDAERHVLVSVAEAARLRELGDVTVHTPDEFGGDELASQGLPQYEIAQRLRVRAVRGLGVQKAVVPERFPVALADRLRQEGVEVCVDRDVFAQRRRAKSARELAGIRRAQRAAEAGMDAARALLRGARDSRRVVTSEQLTAAAHEAFLRNGCGADKVIAAHGWQAAIGHHTGSGPIGVGEPVVIDLFPRDRDSGCYADMTRTYVIGDPPDEVAAWHRLVTHVLDQALAQARAGTSTRALYAAACDIFESAGFLTQRTKQKGEPLEDGFVHGLGHGVGLALHEDPIIGLPSSRELVTGDVITIEPGLYRSGFGGLRLEDLVLITDGGCENLTSYPYDLDP